MKRLNILAPVTVLLMLSTPAFSDDNAPQNSAKAKAKVETTGQVIIEINGVPQVIELGSSPAVLKKQLKNISDGLNKKNLKTDSKSKNQTPKNLAGGSFSYHTIIIEDDNAPVLDGLLNNKQMLKSLPEQVRKQVEEAMKTAGEKAGLQMKIEAGKAPTAPLKKMDIEALLKSAGAELPANVQKQLMKAIQGIDASNMNLSNIQAHAVVIGPDGTMKEYKLDQDENNKSKTKKTQPTSDGNLKQPAGADAKVLGVLKQILQRLDKIESELETLKKSKP